MKTTTETFKLFTDELRLRILMLLDKKELSVCQLMGITGASQPLVSRNLSMLYKGGFLDDRKDGKLRFYSISKDLTKDKTALLDLVRVQLKNDDRYRADLITLKECSEFQKKKGTCDMKTLLEFIEWKKRKRK